MSGATGRLWVNANGGRLELQSDAGDVQVMWNDTLATLYDASSNTAYTFDLPPQKSAANARRPRTSARRSTRSRRSSPISSKHWTVSGAEPSNVAGEQAYTVKVSPSHDGGLLGSAQFAWDALNGVPLRVAIYAQGASSPALALEATDISFGNVVELRRAGRAAGRREDGRPLVADERQRERPGRQGQRRSPGSPPCRQRPASRSPPRTRSSGCRGRTSGSSARRTRAAALVVYGQGLGAIVVVERAKDTQGARTASRPRSAACRPSRSAACTGHELATQLGTILTWDRAGVTYVLAGSVPSGAAETAASRPPVTRRTADRGARSRQALRRDRRRSTTST